MADRDGDPLDACRVTGDVQLDRFDPRESFGWDKADAQAKLAEEQTRLSSLQQRLFAARSDAVLLVLQTLDAGGKDGTIRSVLTGLNPAGVRVWSFGVPSEEELRHDFLWRVHERCPERGMIGVFNRSHYEDVIVVRVKELVEADRWQRRFDHIVAFERLLADEGTHIVKLYLNISKDEQRERLQDRVDDPEERWKFRAGDLDDRERWDDYRAAYEDAISRTSTKDAPWYVVPGDRKWVRNLVVARILRDVLERIDPRYPEPVEGIAGTVVA
jgi:PPK2 family polyphosphate:nucleotide phosphotransferase